GRGREPITLSTAILRGSGVRSASGLAIRLSTNKKPMKGQHGRASPSTRLKTKTSEEAAIGYAPRLRGQPTAREMLADAPAHSTTARKASSAVTAPRRAAAAQAWASVAPPVSAVNRSRTPIAPYDHRGHQ